MSRHWLRQILIFALVIFIAIPTVLTVSQSVRMAFYVYRARDIRLEEFTRSVPMAALQETLLQRQPIKRSDYWRVALAMPPAPDASTYILQMMCYDPHHRIIITNRGGAPHEVEICFQCRKMCTDSSGVSGTPLVWHYTLLSLFQHYGMPERSPGEYSKLQRAAPNQALQPTPLPVSLLFLMSCPRVMKPRSQRRG